MLFSMKVFNPSFLKQTNGELCNTIVENINFSTETVRQGILRSKKFVVGESLLPYSKISYSNMMKYIFGKDVDNNGMFISDEIANKHHELYRKYSKLPYPEIFIENSIGGLLIQDKGEFFLITSVEPEGYINPIKVRITKDVLNLGLVSFTDISNFKLTEDYSSTKVEFAYSLYLYVTSYLTLNALLYINTKNVSNEVYKITKNEATKNNIPKVMAKYYDYHVVDIFHKKKNYEKLSDVVNYSKEELTNRIRAHMVRGHFKQRASGLYWWNPFLRCKTNERFVDKHYEVH